MVDPSATADPLLDLVNDYVDRIHRGESPSIQEYCQRHPELADEIQDLFPTLQVLEKVQPGGEDDIEVDRSLPEQIGDYRIIDEIGRGGMGVVYEAEQESLSRRVALKVLKVRGRKSGNASVRFQREARAAAQMHHSNIVPVFEVGEDGDHQFYAMQLIQGQGLDQVIEELQDAGSETNADHLKRTPAKLNLDTPDSSAVGSGSASDASGIAPSHRQFFRSIAQLSAQVASALAYAHDRNVIHRDIKPSNLLLDLDGVVWVTDFGIAKTEEEAVTRTGDVVGTFRYMSPERFDGKCDARADIYALGLDALRAGDAKPRLRSFQSDELGQPNTRSESCQPAFDRRPHSKGSGDDYLEGNRERADTSVQIGSLDGAGLASVCE